MSDRAAGAAVDDPAHGYEDVAPVAGPVIARRLLRRFEGLHGIAQATDTELADLGVSPRRLQVLRAAMVLGRRALAPDVVGVRLRQGCDVARFFASRVSDRPVEEFWSAPLSVRHQVLRTILHARGTLTGVDVHPRDVFRKLISIGAAAVIFCHNHPSGDPAASTADIELTARLNEVGDLVGISVLDHVVVARGGRWCSVSGGVDGCLENLVPAMAAETPEAKARG